jgi:nucleoside-diphosphate-sugar epimerase
MQLGMVGLGRMGANMTTRLVRGGHEVVAFDRTADVVKAAVAKGARGAYTFEELAKQLQAPRAPFAIAAFTTSAVLSNATTSCPPRTRRVVMFAPILPNPTIPSCMVPSVHGLSTMTCELGTGD